MAADRASIIPICCCRKGKGLFSYENKPLITPFGGDKRDRTADLLNAIDGRVRVHQGQALQKEKTLKYKHFLRIRCFRALYFSASCALDF